MATIDDICCGCGGYGPVAMLATVRRADQFGLCRACTDDPAAVRAFVARFDGERARDPVAHIRGGDRVSATSDTLPRDAAAR